MPQSTADDDQTLRRATPGDDAFLRRLFLDARPELGSLDLPPSTLETLVEVQLAAQLAQVRVIHPSAVDEIIEVGGQAVGRCLTSPSAPGRHLVDLAVLSTHRGRGIGALVVGRLLSESVAVTLSVWHANVGARRLYERLGFVTGAEEMGYLQLRWSAPASFETALVGVA